MSEFSTPFAITDDDRNGRLGSFLPIIRIGRQAPTIIVPDLTLDVSPLSCGEHHRLGPPPSKHHRCGFSTPLPATMTSRVSSIIGADLTLDVCPLSCGEHHRV